MALTDLACCHLLVFFNRFDRFSSSFQVDECRLKTKKIIRWLEGISANSPVT